MLSEFGLDGFHDIQEERLGQTTATAVKVHTKPSGAFELLDIWYQKNDPHLVFVNPASVKLASGPILTGMNFYHLNAQAQFWC